MTDEARPNVRSPKRAEAWARKALLRSGSAALAELTFKVPFTFASPSPVPLCALPAGSVVTRTATLITQPFDGVGAAVEIGTLATPGLIAAPGDVDVAVADSFDFPQLIEVLVSSCIVLTIVPGAGATAGAGLFIVNLKL